MKHFELNKLFTATKVVAVTSLVAVMGFAAPAHSQAYPDRSINYIIPYGPGGESDVTARFQEPYFKKLTEQTVAIQYKPGAGGAAGWSQLNKMPNDGYTMMGVNLPHIILQPMDKKVGYETDDLQNLYWFHYTPDALLVPASSPFKTLDDFVKAAKAKPASLTVSGSGTKSGNELAKARFSEMAGIQMVYIPFKGTGASNTALLGSQVDGAWGYTTGKVQLGDQVRCLAVAMKGRHPAIPDCPTFTELGYDLVGGVYRGIAVPKSTPAETQAKLAGIIRSINEDPTFVKKMEENGYSLVDVGPAEMQAFMTGMKEDLKKLAPSLGIKVN
jgi:tripartite-type tricarboxylate transporter receptor subunit TctC